MVVQIFAHVVRINVTDLEIKRIVAIVVRQEISNLREWMLNRSMRHRLPQCPVAHNRGSENSRGHFCPEHAICRSGLPYNHLR